MKKIAIIGGTFDPVHTAHINIGHQCLNELEMDEVWYIPNYQNHFKAKLETSAEQRLEMLKIATKSEPRFKVLDIEAQTNKPCFTANTLKKLTDMYPTNLYYLIIGEDLISTFHYWKEYESIPKYAQIIMFRRYTQEKQAIINPAVKKLNIRYLHNSVEDISSSQLRKSPNANFLNPKVIEYINENLLYKKERIEDQMSVNRFEHTLQAVSNIIKLNRNPKWVKSLSAAAYFHDIAKDWTDEEQKKLIQKYKPEILKENHNVWHAFAGALHVEHNLLFNDQIIISAIEKHTTADIEMSHTDMLLYVADKICKPNNKADRKLVKTIRKAAKTDLEKAFLIALKWSKDSLAQRNIAISKRQTDIFNHWLKK